METMYLKIADLLFNGPEECEAFNEERPNEPYVYLLIRPNAKRGRGTATVYFAGQMIAQEYLRPTKTKEDVGYCVAATGASMELYRKTEKWCLKNLSMLVHNCFK